MAQAPKPPVPPLRDRHIPGTIPIGPKPESKEYAWRALSQPAKEKLFELRQMGQFGGTPGRAPYWLSQEGGNPLAAIEPLHYILNALAMWEPVAVSEINRFLGVP